MSGRDGMPAVPAWARWALERLLDPAEVRIVLDELAEMHAAVSARHGRHEADRRYRRQLRQYPLRLALGRMRATLSSGSPGAGELGRAARSLLAAPGLTATIVLTVGIGIGGCATIFAMVDTLYLRPLPYPDANRLEWIFTDTPPNRFNFSVVDFQALEEQQTAFERVAAVRWAGRSLTTPDGVEVVQVLEGTPDLLATMGLAPVRGRAPTANEGGASAPSTVLVSEGFAERRMGIDAQTAIGRTVTMDGEPYEVIGVLPPSLGPVFQNPEVLATLRLQPPSRKGPFFLRVFGRLRPDVTTADAIRELRALNERLFPLWADSYQDRNASWGMVPVTEYARGGTGPLLAVLMGAVATVLLIALTNAANLLIARTGGRSRELAVRVALGATRGRVRAHLLVESAWLALGGAALGLLLARAGIALLPSFAGEYLIRVDEARMSSNTIAFAVGLAALSGALFAVAPALRRRGDGDLAGTLRSGGRSATASRSRQRAQRLLVASQLAVVMPLLASAMLLLTSFARLQSVDPGFAPDHLLTMRVQLSPAAYPDGPSRQQFWNPMLDRVEAIPGVVAAALSSERPPDNVWDVNNFNLEDRPTPEGQSERLAAWVTTDSDYFETLGVPLLEGRGFQPSDFDDDAPPVVLVDEAWARHNYPGESAVGRRLYSGGQTSGPRTTIVGVVGTVPYMGIGTSEIGAMYDPSVRTFSSAWLILRTSGEPASITPLVRAELSRLDPDVPLTDIASGDALLRESLTRPRHLSLLLGVFSAVALALAVVGIYGITSYSVQQRRADIAVRLALGGAPRGVLGRTFWEGMRITLFGLGVGLVASLLATGALSGLLYGVAPRDPGSLAAASTVLLAVSALACLIPALRAVRVDPATTLREE